MWNKQRNSNECNSEANPTPVRQERRDDAKDNSKDQKDNDECGNHNNTSA
jgi:hypothetical protein